MTLNHILKVGNGGNLPQVIREVKQQNSQKRKESGISPHAPRAEKGKKRNAANVNKR